MADPPTSARMPKSTYLASARGAVRIPPAKTRAHARLRIGASRRKLPARWVVNGHAASTPGTIWS